jgi:hypothetical protein
LIDFYATQLRLLWEWRDGRLAVLAVFAFVGVAAAWLGPRGLREAAVRSKGAGAAGDLRRRRGSEA